MMSAGAAFGGAAVAGTLGYGAWTMKHSRASELPDGSEEMSRGTVAGLSIPLALAAPLLGAVGAIMFSNDRIFNSAAGLGAGMMLGAAAAAIVSSATSDARAGARAVR